MQKASTIVMIDDFCASKLNNKRRIFVYLPPGYANNPNEHYPVLYMHAGQRAFEQTHPTGDSWHIHTTCDRLIAEGRMEGIIIVAISHVRPVTSNEFYHFRAPDEEAPFIDCTGLDYEDFIIYELKPYIDIHYRTQPDARNTALIGSSAGGLSTYHIGFRNSHIFGKLLMLSPYFVKARLDSEVVSGLHEERLYREYKGKFPLRLWIDIGDAEGLFLPRHVHDVVEYLLGEGFLYGEELAYLLQPDAAHEEAAWAERVEMPLLYMFGKPSRPVALDLLGRKTAGLSGMIVQVNPLIRYENGLVMTGLNCMYEVSNPDVLEVSSNGTIIPKGIGSTTVRVSFEGLETSGEYHIVEELSELVTITISVELPPGLVQESLYGGMGMKLLPEGTDQYGGQFLVPRDSGYQFRFTRGFRQFELAATENRLPNRFIRADRDQKLHFKIERFAKKSDTDLGRSRYTDGAI